MKIFANSYTCYSYHIPSPHSNKSISVVWRGEKLSVGKYPSAPRNTSPQKNANVTVYVCGQLQCGEFALQSVNIPDSTTVVGRLLRIQVLNSVYIFITHQSYYTKNHLLIPFSAGHQEHEITNTLVTYGK
jgi:hypothetical protein